MVMHYGDYGDYFSLHFRLLDNLNSINCRAVLIQSTIFKHKKAIHYLISAYSLNLELFHNVLSSYLLICLSTCCNLTALLFILSLNQSLLRDDCEW